MSKQKAKGGKMKRGVVLCVFLVLLFVALPLLGACTKEKIVEVPVEKIVEKEVIKEVPVEKIVEKEVIKEVPAEKPARILKIGAQYDLTGPSSAFMLPARYGADDYFTYVNDEGILPGVELEWRWLDTRLEPAKNVPHYQSHKDWGADVVMVQMGNDAVIIKEMAGKDKIPITSSGSIVDELYPVGWAFGVVPPWDSCLVGALEWASLDWDYEKEGRNPVFATMKLDIYRRVEDAGHAFAPKFKVDYDFEATYPRGSTDFTPYVLRMKDAAPDYIYLYGSFPDHVAAIKEVYRQGLLEKAKVISVAIGSLPAIAFVTALGPEIAPHVVMISCYGSLTEDDSGSVFGRELIKRYHADDQKFIESTLAGQTYQVGLTQAMLTVEGIKNAVELVGADKVDGDAIYAGLEKAKFNAEGLLPPLEMGPEKHYGVDSFMIFRIGEHGELTSLSEWVDVPTPLELAEYMEK